MCSNIAETSKQDASKSGAKIIRWLNIVSKNRLRQKITLTDRSEQKGSDPILIMSEGKHMESA